MRTEWILASAVSLVVGGVALTLGFGVLPLPEGQGMEQAMLVAAQSPGRWLASCLLIFAASIALSLGVFALLSLLRRDRRFAVVAVGLFTTGTIGMCGYATVLAFIRSLILNDQLSPRALDEIAREPGAMAFALAWQACFLLGLCLIALGLLRNGGVPRWVPVLLFVFVISQFVPLTGGYYATLAKWGLLAVALLRIARAAGEYARSRDVEAVLAGTTPHTM